MEVRPLLSPTLHLVGRRRPYPKEVQRDFLSAGAAAAKPRKTSAPDAGLRWDGAPPLAALDSVTLEGYQ